MGDVLVRLQSLDGQWEVLGVDRLRGIVPEGINPTANPWGSDVCGFTIRRDPGAVWPDLTAFTPVEVFVKGVKRWSGFVWDSEQSQGEEIYNRVIVEGPGPDGSPLRVERRNPVLQNEVYPISSPAPDNPSFDTDTSSWSVATGTIARTTTAGEFDSSPAGGKLTGYANSVPLIGTFSGTFRAGATYVLTFSARASGAASLAAWLGVQDVDSAEAEGSLSPPYRVLLSTTFQSVRVVWTPTASRTGVTLRLYAGSTLGATYYIDSLSLGEVKSTLVDRRGFRRSKALQAQSAQTDDTAAQLGDIWLRNHKTTPFRGLPSSEHKIGVQCRGWPYHLDDDLYERPYVHTRLNDWKDHRSLIDSDLSVWQAGANVSSDQGALVFGFPNGSNASGTHYAGVTLDLGPNSSWERVTITYEEVNLGAAHTLKVRGHDAQEPVGAAAGTYDDAIVDADPTGGTVSGTFTPARRYVTIWLEHNYTGAYGADELVRVTDVKVYAETNYESSNASVLRAHHIFEDAIDRGTILLSDDHSGIGSTSFDIPEYAHEGYRTPREHIETANSYHAMQTKIDVERRPIFGALPSAPKYEVGNWSGVELEGNTLKATGHGAIRRVLGGQAVPPDELLTNTLELIRFAHIIDPDTGGVGRDGRIASCSYDPDKDEITAQIENDEANFDVFVTRWASLSPA